MNRAEHVQQVVHYLGGPTNIVACNVCMTRLRLNLKDMSLIDLEGLNAMPGMLGAMDRGENCLELIYGPAKVLKVYDEMVTQVGKLKTADELPHQQTSGFSVHISPGRRKSYDAQVRALSQLIDPEKDSKPRLKLLVLNGPNLNLLGKREPEHYGTNSYSELVAYCQSAAQKAGFSECRVFQSNHEGSLVDEIQQAMGIYDGIVINPAAYTHTSIALLDALKAVQIPCVEVHLSDVASRESFRQNSYVREACLATITGKGFAGYAEAISLLYEHLTST